MKHLFSRKVRLTALFIIVYSLFFNTAIASIAYNEICFSVKHTNTMFKNTATGQWETLPSLDTTTSASQIHIGLDAIGYSNPYYYLYNSGQVYRDTLNGNAIWFANGHGAAGRMFTTSDYSGSNVTYISSDTVTNDPRAYSIQSKYSSGGGLQYTKLAWFGSCNTANTDSLYGNLPMRASMWGVDAAVGFRVTVFQRELAYFSNRVLCYYGSDSNNTLAASCASAVRDTAAMSINGYAGGCDSYIINGNGNIKIAPASSGN